MSSTLLRVVALPPGAPPAAVDGAAARRSSGLHDDKDFAAEAMKVLEYVPEYRDRARHEPTRSAPCWSPRRRCATYINDYMRNVPKK